MPSCGLRDLFYMSFFTYFVWLYRAFRVLVDKFIALSLIFYWFLKDPEMDLEVESQFSGKSLARLASLIKNQIRRSVRRKHTLPRYKVRYKPFFQQPMPHDGKQEVFVHNTQVTIGKLDVEVIDCSRLPQLPINSQLYCAVSVDSLPWKEVMPGNSSLWPVHEVSRSIHIMLAYDNFVVISVI